jgi:hypothetical protein
MHTLFLSAAQGADAAAAGLSELLKFGVLGIFSVLLIIGLVWVVKAWKASMEARIADAKAYANGLKEVNDAGASLTVETNKQQTQTQVALDALAKDSKDYKDSNSKEHSDLTTAVNGLREKQIEFIAEAKAATGTAKGNG